MRLGVHRGAGALRALIAACAATVAAAAFAQQPPVAPPIGAGPHPVACSNVEQDFTRVAPGVPVEAYWDGVSSGGTTRYVTDLLVDAAHAFVVQRSLPNDSELYGPYAGATVAYANFVCYPTDFANSRADYALPTGNVVPRMQRGAEAPIFPAGGSPWPVLLFSHGLSGSPLSGDYIEVVKYFASHGYVVVAPFHGDLRFADLELDSFQDVLYAFFNYKTFVAMQAVRPLSLTSALDAVLGHPDFRDHADAANVHGFGASLGAESLLLMGGAALTTTLGQASKRVTLDARLRSAVGYVPYFGIDAYPAFGRDLKGLDGVTLPFLALSGTADTTAPLSVVERGMRRLTGTRQLVALTGLTHGFDARYAGDLFTWTLAFLAGQLDRGNNDVARATSARMTAVAGGMEDVQRIDYMAPSPVTGPLEASVVEYRHAALDHYFITAEPAEMAMLDAGVVVPGWNRTDLEFKGRPAGSPFGLAACRFFGTPPLGPNSHFYTIDAPECAKVKADPLWTYEGLAFNAQAPVSGDCGSDRIPVLRLYNDGMGGQANHRFTTSRSESRAMQAAGWIVEGAVFCAIP
jgi:predicted dienelactone hydrolase